MFARLLDAAPSLFTDRSASSLTNTLVYEVQTGAQQLANALMMVVRDSLTTLFLFGYLLWLNWKLTLFIVLLAPAVAFVMRAVSRRLDRLTRAWQSATDELAYVVEENVLAARVVRLHGAQQGQASRFATLSLVLRRLAEKLVVGEIHAEQVTVADQMEYVLGFIKTEKSFVFTALLPGKLTLRRLVATFLAVLELTRLKKLRIMQNEAFTDIICEAVEEIPLETPADPNTVPAADEESTTSPQT